MSELARFCEGRLARWAGIAILAVAAAAVPLFLGGFWLQTGLFTMAAAVGAIGLTLLVGIAGQLSLAHAFFLAVGAYGYCFFAGATGGPSAEGLSGLGLAPPLALVAAVVLAGLAGAAFSPIAGRVKGIYLALASLGLVFVGRHLLINATDLTGGFSGRAVPPFELFGFEFASGPSSELVVFGVPFGTLERLWYLALVLFALAAWYALRLIRSRPGRALVTVRDSEVVAAAMGVNVPRYRAAAFVVSSMYAGLAGVLLALAFGRIVPEAFGLVLSIDYLVMIVIGGLGSVGGAAFGAAFVTALPLLLNRYSTDLPLLAEPGAGGVGAEELSRILYGVAIIAVLTLAPGGAGGLLGRLRPTRFVQRRREQRRTTPPYVPDQAKETA